VPLKLILCILNLPVIHEEVIVIFRKLGIFMLAAVLSALLNVSAHASEITIGFEEFSVPYDETHPGYLPAIPVDPYHGLTQSQDTGLFSPINNEYYMSEEYSSYTPGHHNDVLFASYPNAVFNAGGVQSVTWSSADGTPFDFHSAYIWMRTSGGDPCPLSAHSLTISGYYQGSLVGNVVLSLPEVPWPAIINLNGIDKVVFTRDGSPGDEKYWLMDCVKMDFHPVPIPGAIWLLGSGLIGLAGVRKRLMI
jgi:hypothetical protein